MAGMWRAWIASFVLLASAGMADRGAGERRVQETGVPLVPRRSTEIVTLQDASSDLSVHVSVELQSTPSGVVPVAFLAVTNTTREDTTFPSEVRVLVHGEKAEPETTLAQRRMTRTLRPGDTPIRDGGFEPLIEPGKTFTRHYSLDDLYLLPRPGRYTVSFKVMDLLATRQNAGTWVQSNVASFTLPVAR